MGLDLRRPAARGRPPEPCRRFVNVVGPRSSARSVCGRACWARATALRRVQLLEPAGHRDPRRRRGREPRRPSHRHASAHRRDRVPVGPGRAHPGRCALRVRRQPPLARGGHELHHGRLLGQFHLERHRRRSCRGHGLAPPHGPHHAGLGRHRDERDHRAPDGVVSLHAADPLSARHPRQRLRVRVSGSALAADPPALRPLRRRSRRGRSPTSDGGGPSAPDRPSTPT